MELHRNSAEAPTLHTEPIEVHEDGHQPWYLPRQATIDVIVHRNSVPIHPYVGENLIPIFIAVRFSKMNETIQIADFCGAEVAKYFMNYSVFNYCPSEEHVALNGGWFT